MTEASPEALSQKAVVNRIPLACPVCRTPLEAGAGEHFCPACQRVYSHVLGIPSFRDPETETSPVEKAVVAELCELYPTATFEELLRARLTAYIDSCDPDEELLQQYDQYTSSLQRRGRRFHQMFLNALSEHLSSPHHGVALDIGCGTGAGAAAMAPDFEHVVALDIRMSSLIVAKKLVESQGLSNVTFVQASALQMPLCDRFFDYVGAINVLEHIFEPAVMLQDVHRVLAKGGVFAGDSRNRFDLFFPEPHVKLRCVGFFPRRWMAPYVHWRRGISYETTHLLSYGDLRRALGTVFEDEGWRIVMPNVSAYGFPDWLESSLAGISSVDLLRSVLVRLSPTHLALAQRTT